MTRTYVLDASAFIYGALPAGDLATVPAVYDEVKDEKSRLRLELLEGLRVVQPNSAAAGRVAAAARESGDDRRLSRADADLLALALQEREAGKDAVVLTDDYAVQNVAGRLGVPVEPLRQRKSRYSIVWEKQCTGCKRRYAASGEGRGDECPVCGAPLRPAKRSIARGK